LMDERPQCCKLAWNPHQVQETSNDNKQID